MWREADRQTETETEMETDRDREKEKDRERQKERGERINKLLFVENPHIKRTIIKLKIIFVH